MTQRFTDLIAKHDWPPGFRSRIVAEVDARTKRFITPYAKAQEARRGGFNVHALGLEGAKPFVVMFEARKAIEKARKAAR